MENPGSRSKSHRGLARAVVAVALAMGVAGGAAAQPLERLVFTTNWYAQAEHGGFYQALARGIYRKHGLDVEIRMGGPQVNGLQLNVPRLFAALVVLTLTGVGLFAAMVWLSNAVLRGWHESARGSRE